MSMILASYWLALVQHELLLFAGVCFLIGAIDDLLVDAMWFILKIFGCARTRRLAEGECEGAPLSTKAAVFIPAWREDKVIGDTVGHLLTVWPQRDLCLYVGCYRNDAPTLAAVMQAAQGDKRLRLVMHDRDGPSTKADCLNRLYRALSEDEERSGMKAGFVIFHDAEDMVDAAALPLVDEALRQAEFVQLPVLALPQAQSRWIGSHYCEEFAEAHGKAMVVRDALRTEIPAAGVGCAISRGALEGLARTRSDGLPFAADSLTEDYELGIGVAAQGGRSRFLRVRRANGELVATRAFFPSRLDQVVRQKTRWVHGIAFQGWDRLGWPARPGAFWMRLRDRRSPLSALVLFLAYALLALAAIGWSAQLLGLVEPRSLGTALKILLGLNFAAFVWRAVMRFAFTAREFGMAEGVRAVLRIPVSNIIAIMAGRRALVAYLQTLGGKSIVWDKTDHDLHPVAVHRRGQFPA